MAQTDRQTDKSTHWAFTAYEDQYALVASMSDSTTVAEYGYQDEICPDTNRKHKQGYLRTKQQVRFSSLRKEFPGIHFEVARDWNKLLNYCKKKESRDLSGNIFTGTGSKEKPLTMAMTLIKMVSFADPKLKLHPPNYPGQGWRHYEVPEDHDEFYDIEAIYKSAVSNWLRENPNIIGLVTSPQMKFAFKTFWFDFMPYAIEEAIYNAADAFEEEMGPFIHPDEWMGV